jgi:hypothetical protein
MAEDDKWILGAPPPSKNGVKPNSTNSTNSAKKRKRKTKKRVATISEKTLNSTETSPQIPPKKNLKPKTRKPKKKTKPAK